MSKSDYLENKLLDHTTGKAAYALPTVYLALYTSAPSDSGGGTEVAGGSYARIATAASDWNTAASGASSNATELIFPQATGSWGTVTHVGLLDAPSGGNLLRWGALSSSKAISSGQTAKFLAGDLDLTED